MTSQLTYSKRLGRRIRTGDAASLGVPTDELVLAALAAGDDALAREYLEYRLEEAARVLGRFSIWLAELLEFGRAELPGFDAEVERLTAVIGTPPPVLEDATAVGSVEAELAASGCGRFRSAAISGW